MSGQGFDCVYCWLLFLIGVDVESIEVFSKDIHAEVTMVHSVHIYHRHYHKNKHLSQQMRSQVVFVGEEVNNSLHRV